MKRILLSILCVPTFFMMTNDVKAQQDPYSTHYMFNRMLYNPAVAGSQNKFCVTALSHYQYLGFEDRTPEFWPQNANIPNSPKGTAEKSVGPKTQMFSFSAPVTKYGGLGIGFVKDKLGYENSTHVKIDAAGIYPLTSGAAISLGIEANFLQIGIDGEKLRPLAAGDPSIPTQNVSDRNMVFGAGAYYIDPMEGSISNRNLWVGLSMSNINKPTYSFGDRGTVYHTPESHIYLMGGIDMINFMGRPDLIFHPSAMFKYNTVVQADLTGLLEYQQKLWGGVAYRTTSDAFSIILGYSGFKGKLNGLRVGYSYDLTLSKILSVSS
ncbi:MAG: PorP/SprF family type IX secretion system membrane protein, partial [Bacteroidia bacterium]